MIKTFAVCPSCSSNLIYLPELKHFPSDLPIFKCGNETCVHFDEYMVLGNIDNFGSIPESFTRKRLTVE